MNRILKFRVWDTYRKVFLPDGFSWTLTGANGNIIFKNGELFNEVNNKSTIYVLQQYINLNDKNNREIFEGDILKFDISGIPHGPERENGIIGNVFFDIGFGCWCFGKEGYTFFDRIDKKSLEVIGNVFENEELMDKIYK